MDRSAIGRESKPAINEVEKGAIRRFAEALGESNPIFFDENAAKAAGHRGLVAPPTFPVVLRAGSDVRDELLLAPGKHLLQAEQSFEYARYIIAGDRIVVRSKVIDVAQRQTPTGMADVAVIEDEGRDEGGQLIYRARQLWIVRAAPSYAAAGEVGHE